MRLLRKFFNRRTKKLFLSFLCALVFWTFLHYGSFISLNIEQTLLIRSITDRLNRPRAIEPPVCLWPQLDPWDPEIKGWINDPPKTNCPKVQPNLASLDKNGKLTIHRNEVKKKKIFCFYRSINGSFYSHITELDFGKFVDIKESSVHIPFDQFEVTCYDRPDFQKNANISKTRIYRHAFMQIRPKPERQFVKSAQDKLSVDIIVLDSVSYPHFKRSLPKSLDYMKNTMDFLIFEKPAKVGDNTLVNIIPLLTGKRFVEPNHVKLDNFSSEFPTNRFMNADKDFDFIWNKFKDNSCVTMMNVDPVLKHFGFLYYQPTFVHGFTKAPTDYYFRPGHNYFILHPFAKFRPRFCRGNVPDHEIVFNLTKQWFSTYKDTCHFSIMLALHDYTHDVPSDVGKLEDSLLDLLQSLHTSHSLQNTVLLIIGDHGHRVSPLKLEFQGQIEEHIAFYGIYFPAWFREKYPKIWANMKDNVNKIVTHYDLHETLKDIQAANFVVGTQVELKRGVSLFGKIAPNRTCLDTDTQKQFCVCLVPTNQHRNISDSVREKVKAVIGQWLQEAKYCQENCAESETKITDLRAFTSNEFIQRNVRHFDKEALEKMKKPPKNKAFDFLWFVAEYRTQSRRLLRINGVVQYTKPSAKLKEGRFKLNSRPKIEEFSL